MSGRTFKTCRNGTVEGGLSQFTGMTLGVLPEHRRSCVVDNVVVANPFGAVTTIETNKTGSFEADEIAEVVVCLVEYVICPFHVPFGW